MPRSLHERAGLKPDYRLPTVEICRLEAKDFKAVVGLSTDLHGEVMSWLRRLALHPSTPNEAWIDGIHLHVFSLAAVSQWPWWQIESIRVGPNGEPERDREYEGDEARFHSIFVYPAIPPPPDLLAAIDQATGGKLSDRKDGGPTPAAPRGTGLNLPTKRPVIL